MNSKLDPRNSKPSHSDLVRGLTLVAAMSVVIGNVIGTGVFLKARVMTCNVGTPGKVLGVYVLAGLLSVIAALVSSEQLTAPFGTGWRRAALLLFVLAMALMLAAATATLNLKGTGTDESDTPTGVVVPA